MHLSILLFLCFSPQDVEPALQSIRAREVHAHIEFLAQENLEGRSPGKRGGLLARRYIAAQFKRIGLRPPGKTSAEIPSAEEYDQPIPQVKGAANVVGIHRGSDLAHEAVVIGAHMDHLGVNADRDAYNGADDNASGTSALFEIAEAFALLQPRRTVVFVAFDAEEVGLVGSGYYVENPVVPLADTVAMLNMDMIGRNEANRISAVGTFRTPELQRIIRVANEKVGLNIRFEPGAHFASSDHYPFALQGLPVVHFFCGLHADYHGIADTADKIDTDKVERVSRVAFLAAWTLATRTERPAVELTEEEVRSFAGMQNPELIQRLESSNGLLRYLAVSNLTRRAGDEVLQALIATLGDRESYVRAATLRALGYRGDDRAAPHIIPFLTDPDEELRQAAISTAGRLRAQAALPGLLELAERGESGALAALAAIGGDRARTAIALAFEDPSRRVEAVQALARLKAYDLLARALVDDSEEIRLLSARALRRASGPGLPVEALIAAMRDVSPGVRTAVAQALIREKENKAVRAVMERALQDPASGVRIAAAAVLLPDEQAFQVLVRDFDRQNQTIKVTILQTLGSAQSKAAMEFMAQVLKSDPEARVRKYAVWGLRKSKDIAVIEWLRPGLRDAAPDVRAYAAGALLRRGAQEAVEVLRPIAKGARDRYLRTLAIRELAAGKGEDIQELLLECLDDDEDMVRRTALQILERVSGRRRAYERQMSDEQVKALIREWKGEGAG